LDVATALDRLEFPAHDRDTVAYAAAHASDLAASIEGADAVALWRRLRRVPPEAVAVAGALGPAEAARMWLNDVRQRRLAINGDDLVAAGLRGRAVGEGLEAAHAAMLEGRAPTREEQLLVASRP
jgi:hypothetical protein